MAPPDRLKGTTGSAADDDIEDVEAGDGGGDGADVTGRLNWPWLDGVTVMPGPLKFRSGIANGSKEKVP